MSIARDNAGGLPSQRRPSFAELYMPKLVTVWREGYGLSDFRADVIAGLTVAIGSLLAGAAWNIESLVAFRVLQGFGGGLLMPVGMTVLLQTGVMLQFDGELFEVVQVEATRVTLRDGRGRWRTVAISEFLSSARIPITVTSKDGVTPARRMPESAARPTANCASRSICSISIARCRSAFPARRS